MDVKGARALSERLAAAAAELRVANAELEAGNVEAQIVGGSPAPTRVAARNYYEPEFAPLDAASQGIS